MILSDLRDTREMALPFDLLDKVAGIPCVKNKGSHLQPEQNLAKQSISIDHTMFAIMFQSEPP